MATNFPAAVDTYTNPSASNTMDGTNGGAVVDHDTQHGNLNDAMTAVQTKIGPNSAPILQTGLVPHSVITGTTYSAAAFDLVPVDTTANVCAVTLPTAPNDHTQVCVKMVVQGGTNAVTILTGGSDTFDTTTGGTSTTLTLVGQAKTFEYAHAIGVWYVVSADLPLGQADLRYAKLTGANQVVTGTRLVPRTLQAPAPGGTPAINTDLYEVVELTALAANITNMTSGLTGTPNPGQSLRIRFQSASARTIAWGTGSSSTWGFEFPGFVPVNVVAGVPLDTVFTWNVQSSKWKYDGSNPGPSVVIADLGAGSYNFVTGAGGTAVFATPPVLGIGTWRLDFDGLVIGAASVAIGDSAALAFATGTGYTVLTGPGGNVPGTKVIALSGSASNVRMPVHLTGVILVTAAGATPNIIGVASNNTRFSLGVNNNGDFTSVTYESTSLTCTPLG